MASTYLREFCHSRAGDKGDISNVSVIAYDLADYELIEREVTADRVKAFFGELCQGPVRRYCFPKLGALNFVLERALDGGNTHSRRVDGFGKSHSAFLLSMQVERP